MLEFGLGEALPSAASDDPARCPDGFSTYRLLCMGRGEPRPQLTGRHWLFDTLFSSQGTSGASAHTEDPEGALAKGVRASRLS